MLRTLDLYYFTYLPRQKLGWTDFPTAWSVLPHQPWDWHCPGASLYNFERKNLWASTPRNYSSSHLHCCSFPRRIRHRTTEALVGHSCQLLICHDYLSYSEPRITCFNESCRHCPAEMEGIFVIYENIKLSTRLQPLFAKCTAQMHPSNVQLNKNHGTPSHTCAAMAQRVSLLEKA
jgi:hypothetical protein